MVNDPHTPPTPSDSKAGESGRNREQRRALRSDGPTRNLSWWPLAAMLVVCIVALATGGYYLTRMAAPNPAAPASPTTNVALTSEESHVRMLAALAEIREQRDLLPFLGTADLRNWERQLASFESPPPEAEFQLRAAIGAALLQQGRTEEAIEQMEMAAQLLTRVRIDAAGARGFLFELAVAHLRLGENENCVHCKNHESCLLPIRGAGVHTKPRGSQQAIRVLNLMLQHWPDDPGAAWLLNIAHMTLGTYPDEVPEAVRIDPARFKSEAEIPEFLDVAADAGLNTLNMCGGTIIDDFDNDGLLDIVTSTWDTAGQLHYFRNQGNGKFERRTEAANLAGILGGLNLLQADYDNDGDVDVLVLRGAWMGTVGRHPNSLLRNDGGVFTDVTFASGLGDVSSPTQTGAWGDFDLDGDLDLYVGNENDPCQLFENQGDGKFVDVARRANVLNGRFTKGVVWGDYDNDRFPDIYVSNLGQPNRLYRNLGDGTFRDVAVELGVEAPLFGFPTWFWDFNNDGALDLFASSYIGQVENVAANYLGRPDTTEPDRLYQGDGNGGFMEVGKERGLTWVTLPMGSNFGDFNYDGYPDFYLGTGRPNYSTLVPNLLFMNDKGRRFLNVTSGANVGHLQKGHGVGFADIDNDGDQDIFIQMGGAYPGDAFQNTLFENPGFGNHWLAIRLQGVQSNRAGVGARIRADITEDGGARSIYHWVGSGGSFGANPLRQEIGLGTAQRVDRLEIFWPVTGKTQVFVDLEVDRSLLIVEDQEEAQPLPRKTFQFKRPASGEKVEN